FPPQTELGPQLPHAVRMASGLRLQRRPGVVIGYFGDCASSEGDFDGAGNLAGATDAPGGLFCQNNAWATSTPRQKQPRAGTYAEIDDAFREAQERSAVRTPAMLFDHVYANPPARLERQRRLIEEEEGLWLS